MPTLARARDGHYFIRHQYRGHTTWQVVHDGLFYLMRRGVEEGGKFPTGQFMSLWRRAWVYTGSKPRKRSGPAVVGDQDVPEPLRQAIGTFHAAVRNRDSVAAWSFVASAQPIDSIGEDIVFDRFRRSVGEHHLYSWRRADIRTVCRDFHWIVTMVLKTSQSSIPVTVDESWVRTESGFRVLDNRHAQLND